MVLTSFRVTDSLDNLTLVSLFLCGIGVVYLSVYEVGDETEKPHMHCVVDVKNIETPRKKFLEKFPQYKGNRGLYSWTVCRDDLDTNLRYLCKGQKKNLPCVIHNPKKIDIEYFWVEYWKINNEIKAPKEQKKIKTKTFMEEMVEKFKKSQTRDYEYCVVDMQCIQAFVMKELGDRSKILDEFILKRMILGVLNAVTPRDPKLSRHLFSKMFPDLNENHGIYTYLD